MYIDVARARDDTPGTKNVVHLNNAGASLQPQPVLDAVFDHLRLEAEIGGYEAEARNADRIEHTYDALAMLLNCGRDQIALTQSATDAWNLAFQALEFKEGDRILTSVSEYASSLIAMQQVAKRTGAVVEFIPNDPDGQLDVEALAGMIDERVKLIAAVHVPSNGGLINPAPQIGQIARGAEIPFLLDACQSVGQMPLDVWELGCDFLAATGRKYLRGPRGTGFLCVRPEWLEKMEPRALDLHGATMLDPATYEMRFDARRFEHYESHVAGRIGLGVAADYALEMGLEGIQDRVFRLGAWFRMLLEAVPGVTIHDLGIEKCGLVSFTVEGLSPLEVKVALVQKGINVWASDAASTPRDMADRGLSHVLRASPHYYNTEVEAERLVDGLAELMP
jgi:cysteine desulfurase / selenocysteine lyase